MAELAALNVKINGDASGLQGALNVAEGGLERVGIQAQQTQRQVLATSTGMGRLGQVFQRNGFAISNAANQFSDLAVQIGMGVPASRALSQQLPQMTAFMGPLANIIGVAAGVLIGFAGNLLMSRDNADALSESLETLDRIQGDLNTANEILKMSVYDLTVRYGEYAGAVRQAAESMAILAQAEAQQRMGEALADVEDALRGLTSSGRVFDTAMTTALQNIREQFGLTSGDALRLNDLFQQLETATTFDQQVEALRQIEQFMAETGASASALPPELISALQQINQMVIASGELAGALDEAAASGARLSASLPQTTGGIGPGLYTGDGSIALPPPSGEGGGGGVGGGGGGGMSLADQIERDLERLREGFMTEEEIQLEAYARQQEILQSALEQRLLTQEEYNALMRQSEQSHVQAINALHQASTSRTLGYYGDLFGNMANVFSAGGKELVGITKAFSIAQGLLNSYRAFTEVLADPALIGRPFLRTALAASTLASGLAQVASMRSVGMGGGGVAGAASSGVASAGVGAVAGGAPAAAGGRSQQVALQLTGGDLFSRDQVLQLINAINESVEDGAIVRLV